MHLTTTSTSPTIHANDLLDLADCATLQNGNGSPRPAKT
jgi:hypothetical protein